MTIPFDESPFEIEVRKNPRRIIWDVDEGEDTEGWIISCPFCDTDSNHLILWNEREDIENEIGSFWYVLCDNCQCKGPESPTEEGACTLWNERRGW